MEVPSIGIDEVRERMDSGEVLLVDVREREVVVYCRSGRRSARVVERLIGMGHRGVSNMEGGMERETREGLIGVVWEVRRLQDDKG